MFHRFTLTSDYTPGQCRTALQEATSAMHPAVFYGAAGFVWRSQNILKLMAVRESFILSMAP